MRVEISFLLLSRSWAFSFGGDGSVFWSGTLARDRSACNYMGFYRRLVYNAGGVVGTEIAQTMLKVLRNPQLRARHQSER